MTTSPLVQNSKPHETASTTSKKRNPKIEDFQFRDGLPTAEELPCSDGAAVDSELQELIPGLLKTILLDIWRDQTNWLFSIDMAFHYHPDKPHIAPDGLLSLGVVPATDENMRSSFVLWEENVLPLFALEIVSKTLGSENTTKFDVYQETGILYYLIYAPLRKRKAKFQLYTDGSLIFGGGSNIGINSNNEHA
jgi:Uma2 family endonuclease